MTSRLAGFFLRRLLVAIVFVAVVSASALVFGRLALGTAPDVVLGTGGSPTAVAVARERAGLDRPLPVQLARWFAGLAHFDLGKSIDDVPVGPLVAEHAVKTAWLALAALALATAIGVPLGIVTGARPHGWVAAIVTPLSIALVACPPLVGALALLFLALSTGWLSTAPGHLALPTLALALPLAATLERLQSSAMAEALGAFDLVATSARGVPPARLLWIHAARRSLRPVLGIYGLVIGSLLSGSLAVESVTAWPGLGRLMYSALYARDLMLVAGCVLAGAIGLAAGNLVADLARAAADPRVLERS